MQPYIQVEPPLPRSPLVGTRQSDGVGEHKSRLVPKHVAPFLKARTAYAWVPVRRVQTPCVAADTDNNKGKQPTCSGLPYHRCDDWARMSGLVLWRFAFTD